MESLVVRSNHTIAARVVENEEGVLSVQNGVRHAFGLQLSGKVSARSKSQCSLVAAVPGIERKRRLRTAYRFPKSQSVEVQLRETCQSPYPSSGCRLAVVEHDRRHRFQRLDLPRVSAVLSANRKNNKPPVAQRRPQPEHERAAIRIPRQAFDVDPTLVRHCVGSGK